MGSSSLRPGAQDGGFAIEADDGGFDADRAGAAIENEIDFAIQPFGHVACAGGTQAAGRIGAGGGDCEPGFEQKLLRDGMGGRAHRHRIQARADQQREFAILPTRNHQCQRAGPEGSREIARQRWENAVFACMFIIAHMHDQRIEFGAAFGGEYTGNRGIIGGVGAQAVNRFGRERDKATTPQNFRGGGDGILIRDAKFGSRAGLHAGILGRFEIGCDETKRRHPPAAPFCAVRGIQFVSRRKMGPPDKPGDDEEGGITEGKNDDFTPASCGAAHRHAGYIDDRGRPQRAARSARWRSRRAVRGIRRRCPSTVFSVRAAAR